MTKPIITSLYLASLLGSTFLIGMQTAEARKDGIDARQQWQENRIDAGTRNDSLTRREAIRLQKQQHRLNRQEARLQASGDGLSAKERVRLQREQNALSQNIYQQKHDGQGVNPDYGNNDRRGDLFDVNQTQRNQNKRIYEGIQEGELTPKESGRLDHQQDKFTAREAQMRQGGLTLKERLRLDNAQDRMSRNIYRQKHDAQVYPQKHDGEDDD